MSWIDFLEKNSEQKPNHIALIDQETRRRLNYRNLLLEINKWTEYLLSQNIKKGDRVAYLKTNSIEHLTLFFACVKIGAIFVPLNYRLSWEELDIILHIIGPSLPSLKGTTPLKKILIIKIFRISNSLRKIHPLNCIRLMI
jgi:fatty-acyl-CoA synthase